MALIEATPDRRMTNEAEELLASLPAGPLGAHLHSHIDCAAERLTSRRKRLWEIPLAYHCPLLGTCVSMEELRQLAKRAGVVRRRNWGDYALHHAAVSITCERNALSELVQRLLEDRHRASVRRFSAARDSDQLIELWRDCVARGEVAGALWALLCHPRADEGVLDLVGQDVHMLSHRVGACVRADLKRLRDIEQQNTELRRQLDRQRDQAAATVAARERQSRAVAHERAEIGALRVRLAEAEARVQALAGDALSRAEAALEFQTQRADRAEGRAETCAAQLGLLSERCLTLERESKSLRGDRKAAESALRDLLSLLHEREPTSRRGCASLAGRRVLCVGGRHACVEYYRALVEQSRGNFEHHDGGVEHSEKRLHALLASADAVICMAGHVSHGAYYVVKRFCKKHGKPCILLKNDGASSFLNGVRALAGGSIQTAMSDTLLVAARR